MVGISVRMLHHYDKIGLLKPESISPAGYRFYSDKDLETLQQVLFFKELEFSLKDIKDIKDIIYSPSFDRQDVLKAQEILLIKKKERLEQIIKMVRKTLQSLNEGMKMDKKEMFKAFDMSGIEKDQENYAEEIKSKYGNTDAYREGQDKISKYTKEDFDRMQVEGDILLNNIADLMDKGSKDMEVQKAVAKLRQHITDNLYHCTPIIFRGIGDMYLHDIRITENKEGLAMFLKDAINIYCDNLENNYL